MRRTALIRALTRHFLVYVALTTVAIAQPLLQLYGDNLAMFTTANWQGFLVLWFMLVVLVAPPVLLLVIEVVVVAVAPRRQGVVHPVLVSVAMWAVLLLFTRSISFGAWPIAAIVTFSAAGGLGFLYARRGVVGQWIRWMSPLAIATGVLFAISAKDLVWVPQVQAADIVQSDGAVAENQTKPSDVSVVWFMFDETPLVSMVNSRGEINSERFPGFAKLASVSTWYRNTLGTSQDTIEAVPAMLSSQWPVHGATPTAANYPKNAFTMVAKSMAMDVHEVVTRLCPTEVCKYSTVSGDSNTDTTSTTVTSQETSDAQPRTSFGKFLNDALVVLGHKLLPAGLRDRLPTLENGWGGFGDDIANTEDDLVSSSSESSASSSEDATITTVLNQKSPLTGKGQLGKPADYVPIVQTVMERSVQSTIATFHFVHALLPHKPWQLTPDLRQYPWRGPYSPKRNPKRLDQSRDEYQAYLYQLQAVDTMVGSYIDQLRASANWDRTMVIVTSDHGQTFEPGLYKRREVDTSVAGSVEDIYRVPLFIKYPDQVSPEVSDCAAMSIDILPTIAAAKGLDTGWKMVGSDLKKGCPVRSSRTVIFPGGKTSITSGVETLVQRADRYGKFVSNNTGQSETIAVGPYAGLLGRRVTASSGTSVVKSWSAREKDKFAKVSGSQLASVPLEVSGTITLAESLPRGTWVVILVDNIVAGFVGESENARSGTMKFRTLLDFARLTPGRHSLSMVLVSGDPKTPVIATVGPPT